MKLKPLVFAMTLGIMCALAMLVITYYPVITSKLPFMNQHGVSMRMIMVDIYPVYMPNPWYKSLLGPVFGFIDGFIFGYLTAAIYNWGLKCCKK